VEHADSHGSNGFLRTQINPRPAGSAGRQRGQAARAGIISLRAGSAGRDNIFVFNKVDIGVLSFAYAAKPKARAERGQGPASII
jgi:hypothetical protein